LIQFGKILSNLPHLLLNKDAMETLCKVRDQHGQKLLHEAIFGAKLDDDLYATVRFLLYAGCDPNAIDKNGYTSLHCLSHLNQQYLKGDLNTIAVLLLDFGAQFDIKNTVGKTTVDVLIRKNKRNRNMDEKQGIIGWKIPELCTELPRLTCLSARVIRRNRLPYLKLPISFISMIEKPQLTK